MKTITGMQWLRDREKEDIMVTIASGLAYFKEKYKMIPEIIECSKHDIDEPFIFEGIQVIPVKGNTKGNVWYQHSDLTKKENIENDR